MAVCHFSYSSNSCPVSITDPNSQSDGFLFLNSFGQTITPTCDGQIVEVFIPIASATPVQMQIFQGSAPSSNPLATVSGTIMTEGWLFSLPQNLVVQSGTTYYLRFTNTSQILYSFTDTMQYNGGSAFVNDIPFPNRDIIMNVSIEPQAVLATCDISRMHSAPSLVIIPNYTQQMIPTCNAALTSLLVQASDDSGGSLTLNIKKSLVDVSPSLYTTTATSINGNTLFLVEPPILFEQNVPIFFEINSSNNNNVLMSLASSTESDVLFFNGSVFSNFSSGYTAFMDTNAPNAVSPFYCSTFSDVSNIGQLFFEAGQSFSLDCGGVLDKIVFKTGTTSTLELKLFEGNPLDNVLLATVYGDHTGSNFNFEFLFPNELTLQPQTSYTFVISDPLGGNIGFFYNNTDVYPNGDFYLSGGFIGIDLRFYVGLRQPCQTPAPIVPNTQFSYIFGQSLADISVQGTDIVWFDAPLGGNQLTPNTAMSYSNTYYVAQTLNGCVGPRVAVNTTEILPTIANANCNTTVLNTQQDRIYATEIPGVSIAQWVFKIDNGTQSFEVTRQVNFIHFFDFMPNITYGTTYQVSVAVYLNGFTNGFGPSCPISITGSPKTSLAPAFCNATLPSINTNMSLRAVDLAMGYRIYVKNMTSGNTQSIVKMGNTSESRRVRISDFSNSALGTTFKVWAEVTLDGTNFITVLETDPEVCEVTTPTPPIPTTQMVRCGTTLPGMNVNLTAAWVSDLVQEWNYVVVDANDNTLSQVTKSTNGVQLSEFSGLPITGGTGYRIKVRVRMYNTWGNFGTTCIITTPGFAPGATLPTTQLQASRCNTVIPGMNVILRAAWVSDQVTSHTFALVDANNNILSEVERPNNDLILSQFPGVTIVTGTVYRIRVKVRINNEWSAYGGVCTITTPGGQSPITKLAIAADMPLFKVEAYPNPFSEHIQLNITTSSTSAVEVRIFDMTGKCISNTKLSDVHQIQIGNALAPGIYHLQVIQDDKLQLLKIVKK